MLRLHELNESAIHFFIMTKDFISQELFFSFQEAIYLVSLGFQV
jgi:hypothetical protein